MKNPETKKAITVLVISLLIISSIFPVKIKAETNTELPVKIMIIGNSYVLENDLPGLFMAICDKEKWNVDITTHAYNDGGLPYLTSLPKVQNDIKNGNYDFIILQEHSFDLLDYFKDTMNTVKALKKMAPASSEFYFYETPSHFGEEWRQQEYTDAYALLAKEIGGEVIPAGQAFWAYADSHPYEVMFKDNLHPTAVGSQVIAQCFFDTLYDAAKYNKVISFQESELKLYAGTEYQVQMQNVPEGSSIKYQTSDSKVAEIDSEGKIIPKVYGSCIIFAEDEKGNAARCKVQVGFSDVKQGEITDGVYTAVTWGAERGIIAGFNGGEYFGPEESCTRAQFVTFLWRLQGRAAVPSGISGFTDVDTSAVYIRAINWAVYMGIINGFDDGTFRPEDTLTRRQAAIMLWRMAGKPETLKEGGFEDVALGGTGNQAISWGASAGLIKGYEDGTFRPEEECLRQHIAVFLYRYSK